MEKTETVLEIIKEESNTDIKEKLEEAVFPASGDGDCANQPDCAG